MAVFGALISASAGFEHGLRISLTLAAAVALIAALAATRTAAASAWHLPPREDGTSRREHRDE